MASKSTMLLLSLTILALLSSSTTSSLSPNDNECIYLIYIKTGTVARAGTHSKISLQLKTATGEEISVPNLEEWGGLMGPNHNFFETASLDIFSGKAPCFSSPICSLNLTSDGSGPYHAWYCDYVEIITTGLAHPCQQRRFPVGQWLARDQDPFTLTALKDYCHVDANGDGNPPLRLRASIV